MRLDPKRKSVLGLHVWHFNYSLLSQITLWIDGLYHYLSSTASVMSIYLIKGKYYKNVIFRPDLSKYSFINTCSLGHVKLITSCSSPPAPLKRGLVKIIICVFKIINNNASRPLDYEKELLFWKYNLNITVSLFVIYNCNYHWLYSISIAKSL